MDVRDGLLYRSILEIVLGNWKRQELSKRSNAADWMDGLSIFVYPRLHSTNQTENIFSNRKNLEFLCSSFSSICANLFSRRHCYFQINSWFSGWSSHMNCTPNWWDGFTRSHDLILGDCECLFKYLWRYFSLDQRGGSLAWLVRLQ